MSVTTVSYQSANDPIVVTVKPTGESANWARGGSSQDFFLLVVADFYAIRGHCRYSFGCRRGSKGDD